MSDQQTDMQDVMSQEIKVILTDIEGTTSSIKFVHDVLFPYAYKKLADYVYDNENGIENILHAVRQEECNKDLSLEEVIEVLLRYIDEDQKITPLKDLQGMIWKEGYENGELKGHVYDDAFDGLRRWKDQGIDLYVYSSGSVSAQKLLFKYTDHGDLTPLFSGYFDTTTGGKKEEESYKRIAEAIETAPESILFLSDSLDEVNAARDSGMNVMILDREKTLDPKLQSHPVMESFDKILLEMVGA